MTDRLLYSVPETAQVTGFSVDTIRKALRATDPTAFPPPLRAKRDGRGHYRITRTALQEWIDSLPDA